MLGSSMNRPDIADDYSKALPRFLSRALVSVSSKFFELAIMIEALYLVEVIKEI